MKRGVNEVERKEESQRVVSVSERIHSNGMGGEAISGSSECCGFSPFPVCYPACADISCLFVPQSALSEAV